MVSLLHPRSVIDVGCGVGFFLSTFLEQGVTDITGLDGDWVDRSMLLFPEENFVTADVGKPLEIDRQYDLVVSLEVAEHLPPEHTDRFVKSLTSMGPAVLFSAAIPYQGGANHLKEQWQSYWAELFAARDYVAVDCIRKRTWDDDRVVFWYSENTLLYAHRDLVSFSGALQKELDGTARSMLDLVHPDKYLPSARVFGSVWKHIPTSVKRLAYAVYRRFAS